jgi:pimeloyl-ACP methyl ester carboxylesterase
VVAGAAPLEDADVPLLVGANAQAYHRIRRGGWPDLFELLAPMRAAVLNGPLTAFRGVMARAPAADAMVMADPAWQAAMTQGLREALRPGAEGWTDESLIVLGAWDLTPEHVTTDVTWWHGRHDANAPLSAVQRLITRLPHGHLRIWDSGGHLEAHHHEPDILHHIPAQPRPR